MTSTLPDIQRTLLAILAAHPIYGARCDALSIADAMQDNMRELVINPKHKVSLCIGWGQAWVADCNLTIVLWREVLNPGRTSSAPGIRCECEVSWSATSRTVSRAFSAITLYRQVTELAALIETAVDGTKLEAA